MNKSKVNNEEQEKKKKIIMIIILILLLLLLITSCTSKFWGSIGDWFQNEGNYSVDNDSHDKDTITNGDLLFDVDYLEIYLDDPKPKIGYSFRNIDAKEFTCTTNDAEVATCYVQDGYVVVNPKKIGNVVVTIQAQANGKIYKSSANVLIKEGSRALKLSSNSGKINLNYNNRTYVTYSLIGITGDVTLSSSDESIATAHIDKNGAIEIIAYKPGNVSITVSVTYGGIVYSSVYQLEVYGSSGGNTSIPGGNNPSVPGGNNPSAPGGNNPSRPEKDGNSYLANLTISSGSLNFRPNVFEYYVGVSSSVSSVNLNAITSSPNAKLTYTYNGKTVNSLKDLVLNTGDNVVIITVTAEDGSKSTYKVVINREASKNNSLSSLGVNHGTLTPSFDPNILDYVVNVDSSVPSITVSSSLADPTAKVQYKVDGQVVDNLNDIPLKDGANKIEIIVTSEDGTKRVYTVTVNKALSDNNYLSNIIVSDFILNETFDKNKDHYTMDVAYNTSKLSLVGIPEHKDSTVKYFLDGKEVSLDNLTIINKDSKLEIVVTSPSGKDKVYTIDIHKPDRTIYFENDSYTARLEDSPYKLIYFVDEDGEVIQDYDEKDVKLNLSNFKGTYEICKGYVLLYPDKSMANQTAKAEITYNGSTSNTSVLFVKDNYYLDRYSDSYTIKLENGTGYRNIVLSSNLLTGTLRAENVSGGIRLKGNGNDTYIEIIADSDIVSLGLADNSATSNPSFKVTANKNGTVTLKVKGVAFGQTIKEFEIVVHVVAQYTVTLKSNGGIFNDFGDTEYVFKKTNGDVIDLSVYNKAYKKVNDCEYYPLIQYNTKADGTGSSYELFDSSGGEIHPVSLNVSGDLILYAIYDESRTVTLPKERKFYVVDIPLFKNDEYYELYNKENMIYPGAHGSYVMHIKNVSDNDIEIFGMTLEEDTICVPEGCLNMGYNVRYAPTGSSLGYHYYYGSHRDDVMKYKVLNHDVPVSSKYNKKEILFPSDALIPIYNDISKGQQEIEITLFWKWVDNQTDTDDNLGNADFIDTLIGNSAMDINNKYALTLSFDYRIIDDKCSNP